MATYGPSYTSTVYIGSSEYRRYRGYLYCTTSETNTTVTISYTAKVQMADAAQYGVKIAVSGGSSATGYLTSSSSSFKDVCTTTGTLSVSKGTSATTKTVTATASGTTVNGYGSAGGSASVSLSVSIPAKPSYKVSYNANGGSGAPSAQTKWYGTTLTLSSTVPSRNGYNFLGWSTSSTATTATYKAGGSYTSNAAVTLYAVWKLAYAAPAISNLQAVRCNETGSVATTGKFVKVTYDWNVDAALTLASGSISCEGGSLKLVAVGASAGSSSEILGGALLPLSTYTITASIVDSAGQTVSSTYELGAEEYSYPKISSIVAFRTDEAGNPDDEGTNGFVSFDWQIDEMDGTNAVVDVTIGYREKEAYGDFIGLATTFAGTTTGTASSVIAGGLFDANKSYYIVMAVTDKVVKQSRATIITRSFYTLDFKAGGKGIALGKAAEADGLEIAMPARFNETASFGSSADFAGKVSFAGDVSLNSGATLENARYLSCLDVNGGSRNVIGLNPSGNLLVGFAQTGAGATYLYGTNVYIRPDSTSTAFRPYLQAGDSLTIESLRIAGYVANSGLTVYFWVPVSKPIIGSPSVTVASTDGFVFRQSGQYPYGSGASTYVKPTSYSAGYHSNSGIRVAATFSSSSDVDNLEVIGIAWSGTITFS